MFDAGLQRIIPKLTEIPLLMCKIKISINNFHQVTKICLSEGTIRLGKIFQLKKYFANDFSNIALLQLNIRKILGTKVRHVMYIPESHQIYKMCFNIFIFVMKKCCRDASNRFQIAYTFHYVWQSLAIFMTHFGFQRGIYLLWPRGNMLSLHSGIYRQQLWDW